MWSVYTDLETVVDNDEEEEVVLLVDNDSMANVIADISANASITDSGNNNCNGDIEVPMFDSEAKDPKKRVLDDGADDGSRDPSL